MRRRWLGRPPSLNAEQHAELAGIHSERQRLRQELRRLPTNAELATRLGVSARTIANHMRRAPKRY